MSRSFFIDIYLTNRILICVFEGFNAGETG
jgi:hypothetical protein